MARNRNKNAALAATEITADAENVAQTLATETATDGVQTEAGTDMAGDAQTGTDDATVGTDGTADEGGADAATEAEPTAKRSIVPNEYKRRYKATNNSCGDELADVFAGAVKTAKGTDIEALRRVGDQNGINVLDRWGHLNVGQQRMNLSNVLRNRIKNGEPVWVGETAWNAKDEEKVAA